MSKNGMRPVHPGEVLREDYLKPLGMSAKTLAHHILMPVSDIDGILRTAELNSELQATLSALQPRHLPPH